jgi:hypothetical protein
MDLGNEKLFKDKSDARKFELSLEIKVNYKGITFYFERRNHVHSGTKQHNV